MNKFKTIFGVFLGATMLSGVGSAVYFTNKEDIHPVKASSTEVTEINVYDNPGWNFLTVWIDSFSYYSGYSSTDLTAYVSNYYVTSLSNWEKEGTTKSYHFYGSGVNLCAGGEGGKGTTKTFYLPWWITDCNITVENNSNSYNCGKLTALRKYSNNTSELQSTSGYKQKVWLTAKDWGAESSFGDSAASIDYGTCTITKNAYDHTGALIQSLESETINKYNRYSPADPIYISGYAFAGWYTNAALTTSYSTKLLTENIQLYAKYNAVSATFDDGSALSYNSANSQFEGIKYFEENATFHIVKTVGSAVTNYAALDSYMSSSVATSDGTNVTVKKAGTYAVYFKDNNTIWLQIAEASQIAYMYAGYFLTNVGCDATGATLPKGWATVKNRYESSAMNDDARDFIYNFDPSTAEEGDDIAEMLARYQIAIRQHPSLDNFLKDSDGNPRYASLRAFSVTNSIESNNALTIITIIAAIGVLTTGAYMFFKKGKKVER